MHVKEAMVDKNDLFRFADGLVILKEQMGSHWEQDRVAIAIAILRAMAAETTKWSLVPTEDLEELRREAASK